MNETLEAMARALFKSWFVDFDPVRAKAEGRDPGLPKPIADLFPNSFEDSELGRFRGDGKCRNWRWANHSVGSSTSDPRLSERHDIAPGSASRCCDSLREGDPLAALASGKFASSGRLLCKLRWDSTK